jgi:hypothetical protein
MKYVEFDTRKANLNLIPEDINSVQSSLYTVRRNYSMLLSTLVVHRIGYNSDTFKGAD